MIFTFGLMAVMLCSCLGNPGGISKKAEGDPSAASADNKEEGKSAPAQNVYSGPPVINKVWGSFLRHPDSRIALSLSDAIGHVNCKKISLSKADQAIGTPMYVGWDAKSESPKDFKIQIFIDTVTAASVPDVMSGDKILEESVFKSLLDAPKSTSPALEVDGDVPCVYFYAREAAYGIRVKLKHKQQNIETDLTQPVVISTHQNLDGQDLVQYIQKNGPPQYFPPEDPDKFKYPWVKVNFALPEQHHPEDAKYLKDITAEYAKVIDGLEYLTHFYVDGNGDSAKVSVPRPKNPDSSTLEFTYEWVDPFDFFVFLKPSVDGPPSARHSLLTYRYNDACNFSINNAKIEACRQGNFIILYPQYFNHEDDFRRASILVHEASHKPIKEGGVGPHNCGRGADVSAGSYSAGISVLRGVMEHSANCLDRSNAYAHIVNICSLNVVSSKEFYNRHCKSGTCNSQWATMLKDFDCKNMESLVNPNGECFPGMKDLSAPAICSTSIESFL